MKKTIVLVVIMAFFSFFAAKSVFALVFYCQCDNPTTGASFSILDCSGGCESNPCGVGYNCSDGIADLDDGSTEVPDGGSTGVGGTAGGGGTTLDNPLGDTFEDIVKSVITAILGLTGVLALLAFIYGGLVWMTSGGDPAKVKKGKDVMLWAVFGIIIIFAAYAVLTFIFTALGVTGK